VTKTKRVIVNSPNKLASWVKEILKLTIEKDCQSLCLLAISTGIFNFPLSKWVNIYQETICKFIDKHEEEMKGKDIILCNHDEKTTKKMKKGKETNISFNLGLKLYL